MSTITSSRVTYTDRSGKLCSVTIPSHMTAQYVKNLGERVAKTAKVETVGTVLAVAIATCPEGSEAAQKEASNLRWRREMRGETYVSVTAQAWYDAEKKLLAREARQAAELAERRAAWDAANVPGFDHIECAILGIDPEAFEKATAIGKTLLFHRVLGLKGDPHTGVNSITP
jgi:hypothetical protein